MSSSSYETVYEHYEQVATSSAVSTPVKKLSRKEKLKASLKKAVQKTKAVAKKGVAAVKKGGSVVVKKAKSAAGWMVFYIRCAQAIFLIVILAYIYSLVK